MKQANRRLLFVLAAIQFTHIMDFMVMMPLGPQLIRAFGITSSQFGLLVASYTISAGIFSFIGAFFLDRFGRKAGLRFMYGGFILGTIACALAPTYEALLVTRMLTGMFGGLLSALILSIIGDVFPPQKRATAMGIVMSAFSAAAALGVPFGIYFAAEFNWHFPFYFLGAVGVLVWLGIQAYVPVMRAHLVPSSEQQVRTPWYEVITRVLRSPSQLWALALSVSIVLGQFMIIPYLANYMSFNIGFSDQQLSWIYLLGGALTFFTGPFIGRIADKYGHRRIFWMVALVSIIPMLLVTHLPEVPITWALIATSLFFIFISGRSIPANTIIVSSVSAQHRGSFMSFKSAVQQLTAGIASFVAGKIIVETPLPVARLYHYDWVGYLGVALTFVAIFVVFQIHNKEEISAPTVQQRPPSSGKTGHVHPSSAASKA